MAISTNSENEVGLHREAPQFSRKSWWFGVGSSAITENLVATKTSAWDGE
jgi:hypothetical protein